METYHIMISQFATAVAISECLGTITQVLLLSEPLIFLSPQLPFSWQVNLSYFGNFHPSKCCNSSNVL